MAVTFNEDLESIGVMWRRTKRVTSDHAQLVEESKKLVAQCRRDGRNEV